MYQFLIIAYLFTLLVLLNIIFLIGKLFVDDCVDLLLFILLSLPRRILVSQACLDCPFQHCYNLARGIERVVLLYRYFVTYTGRCIHSTLFSLPLGSMCNMSSKVAALSVLLYWLFCCHFLHTLVLLLFQIFDSVGDGNMGYQIYNVKEVFTGSKELTYTRVSDLYSSFSPCLSA